MRVFAILEAEVRWDGCTEDYTGLGKPGVWHVEPMTDDWKMPHQQCYTINHPNAPRAKQLKVTARKQKFIDITRTQIPLSPEHIVTYQNVQGQTIRGPEGEAKGMVIDLFRPQNMRGDDEGRAQYFQHVYMGLGRARALDRVLIRNFPRDASGKLDWSIFEDGPPRFMVEFMKALEQRARKTLPKLLRAQRELGVPAWEDVPKCEPDPKEQGRYLFDPLAWGFETAKSSADNTNKRSRVEQEPPSAHAATSAPDCPPQKKHRQSTTAPEVASKVPDHSTQQAPATTADVKPIKKRMRTKTTPNAPLSQLPSAHTDMAASAAEVRALATEARGIGDVNRARQMSLDSTATMNSGDEQFGERDRKKLRRDLEKSRALTTALRPDHTSAAVSLVPESKTTQILGTEPQLPLAEQCMMCFSLDVATATETERCIATQKLHCCHGCQQQGCWTTNVYCGRSDAKPSKHTRCQYCFSTKDVYGDAKPSRDTWPNSSLCLHWQSIEGWHCVETFKNTRRHVCKESPIFGCVSCSKMCHADNNSDRCEFFGKVRGQIAWTTTRQESQDALMHKQDLQGKLPHMTELPWKLLGVDAKTKRRFVEIEGVRHRIGDSSGQGYNCLLYSLRQCLGVDDVDVRRVRADLQKEFGTSCNESCSPIGTHCLANCTKVYAMNFLCTTHCQAAVLSIFSHCTAAQKAAVLAMAHTTGGAASSSASAPDAFTVRDFCVRVIELRSNSSSGCVEGPPTAPVRLTVARENGNHFVPVFREP